MNTKDQSCSVNKKKLSSDTHSVIFVDGNEQIKRDFTLKIILIFITPSITAGLQ